MTEEEKLEQINKKAGDFLDDWLMQLENGEVTTNDLVSSLYAGMVTAYLYGYNPDAMAAAAKTAASRLLAMVENEAVIPEKKTCKNKDEKGECPLHNLHCQYPECEK
jgi:hypothetical protein